jgi:hypothetical protein
LASRFWRSRLHFPLAKARRGKTGARKGLRITSLGKVGSSPRCVTWGSRNLAMWVDLGLSFSPRVSTCVLSLFESCLCRQLINCSSDRLLQPVNCFMGSLQVIRKKEPAACEHNWRSRDSAPIRLSPVQQKLWYRSTPNPRICSPDSPSVAVARVGCPRLLEIQWWCLCRLQASCPSRFSAKRLCKRHDPVPMLVQTGI